MARIIKKFNLVLEVEEVFYKLYDKKRPFRKAIEKILFRKADAFILASKDFESEVNK